MVEPKELNYKYKVDDVRDEGFIDDTMGDSIGIRIYYSVMWRYGILPWQYKPKWYDFKIPTCKHPDKDKINIFHGLKARDLPDELIKQLVEADIQKNHLEDGLTIAYEHSSNIFNKWSKTITKQMEYDEKTGLTPQREESIELLKKEWYGNSN